MGMEDINRRRRRGEEGIWEWRIGGEGEDRRHFLIFYKCFCNHARRLR
jgi:hypothetical protein